MNQDLESLRQQIDQIDEQLVKLISMRMDVVQEIGALKQESGQQVQDPRREAKVYVKMQQLSNEHDVPLEVIMHISDYLMSVSRDSQREQQVET